MSLTDQYAALDRTALQGFIGQQCEHLQLDFKTVNSASFNRDDRRSLACALSGFANSSGGLIVWGVDARPNSDAIDCATALFPIDNLPLFLSRLNQLTSEAASPAIDGVQHRAIPFEGTAGCAVTLVPESASGPHMAKLGEDRYYKRNGSSFIRLEHFDLADMFGRRMRPDLQLAIELREQPTDPPSEQVIFSFVNQGRALARHYGLICTLDEAATVTGTDGIMRNQTHMNEGKPVVSTQDDHGVIHPVGTRMRAGVAFIKRPDRTVPLTVSVQWYCEHMAPKSATFSVAPDPRATPPSAPT
jgi:hypothetical protein